MCDQRTECCIIAPTEFNSRLLPRSDTAVAAATTPVAAAAVTQQCRVFEPSTAASAGNFRTAYNAQNARYAI